MGQLTAAERFWQKVSKTETCWNWTAALSKYGYGQFRIKPISEGGTMQKAHRVAYELTRGSIPAGLQLDHLCRNRACVRPDHLEPVDNRTNTLRGVGLAAKNAVKTHCPQGHPYDDENTYVSSAGYRQCKKCRTRRDRNRKSNNVQESR